jgi:hypothetical protein
MRSTAIALTLALATLAAPVLAQDPPKPTPAPTPQPEGERRRPGGMPFANAEWAGQAVEFLAKELELDAGQQEKIKTILSQTMRDAMKKAAEQWDPTQGMPDMQKMRTFMEDARVEIAQKIDAVLSPEQRKEFEVLVDQFDRRAQSYEQQARAYQTPSEAFDPAPISKRVLLDKAERSLFLGPDETAAVMPFVEKAIDLQIALNEGRKTRRQDLQVAIEGGASEKEIRQRLDGMHDAEDMAKLELAGARTALRELLTLEQEIRMVAMGILD